MFELTGLLLVISEQLLDLVPDFSIGDLDVVLGAAIIGHEGQETVVADVELIAKVSAAFSWSQSIRYTTYESVFLAADVGDVHVVGGRAQIFQLLASEDVDGDQVNLGVTVLAGLGGGHFDNLAWAVLDHNEAVLPQRRTLHGIGGRGTGVGALERVLMLVIREWSAVVSRK